MAKTPRSSKATAKAKATSRKPPTRSAAADEPAAKQAATKQAAAKKAAKPAVADEPAATKATKAKPAPAAGKKAAKKGAAEPAPVAKKKATKKAAAEQAPVVEKSSAKKKTTKKAAEQAPVAEKSSAKKKATKKAAEQAPAKKKATKKAVAEQPPAPAPAKAKKKAAKKTAPASQQLALTMDIDPPATDAAPAPASPLQPGDTVPDFSLASDDGQTYSRASLAGQRFVLYFYPKDDTPGCTREACDFRDNQPQFDAASVKVFGVSSDTLKSHGRFRSKYGLQFPLLADPDRTLAQAFGAVGMKKMYGKSSVGVIRSTFVVGPDGTIEKTFSPVKVDGHAAAVLQAIGSG
jgi:peroxiredoxin